VAVGVVAGGHVEAGVPPSIPLPSLIGKRPPHQQWAQPAVRKQRFVLTRSLEDRAAAQRASAAAAFVAAVASAEAAGIAASAAAELAPASAKYRAAVATAERAKEEATNAIIAAKKAA